jgi:hypothetical protein
MGSGNQDATYNGNRVDSDDRNPDHPDDDNNNEEVEPHHFESSLEDFQLANEFIHLLRHASLDDEEERLDPETLHRLRNPLCEPPTLDADQRLSIDIFLAVTNASEQTYNSVREALLRRYPDSGILSHHAVKKLVRDVTGVVHVTRDICINSCMAYTGPLAHLEYCKFCHKPRYDTKYTGAKVPRQQYNTVLLGPLLQALRRSPEGAAELRYRERITQAILDDLNLNDGEKTLPYTNIYDGTDYIEAYRTGKIKKGDILVTLTYKVAMAPETCSVAPAWLPGSLVRVVG